MLSGPAQEKTKKKSQNIHKLGNSSVQYFITSNLTTLHAVKQWLEICAVYSAANAL